MTVGEPALIEPFLGALREDDPQRLYDLAPCGYLSTTPDGVIVKVNRTFAAMCGCPVEELVGLRRFDELLTTGGRIYHETHFAPMLRMQGAAREIALELALPDGRSRPVLVNAAVEDDDGSPAIVRLAVFDATHRRSYERELLAATRRAEESDARARALAATLQQTLLPPLPPAIDGLDLAAEFLPGEDDLEIGGDFYDVFRVGADGWMLAIGDVCGRGVEAAVVTALARFTIRAEAMQHEDPADVLRVLNDVLIGYHAGRFCTAALVRLSRSDNGWHARLACGGHPLPLLRRGDGSIEAAGRHGTLLGVLPDARSASASIALAPGDALVLYTDGVLEARRDDEFFDEAGLRAAITGDFTSAAAITTTLVREVLQFKDEERRDDIAVLVARVPTGRAGDASGSR